MKELKELTSDLYQMKSKINGLLRDYGVTDFNEFEMRYTDNPEENFLIDAYSSIINKLKEIDDSIEYLKRPITAEGYLSKNSRGRYAINNSIEFTSGNTIEFLMFDEWSDCEKWVSGRIEHTDGDYYIYGHKEISLEGLRVRTRR